MNLSARHFIAGGLLLAALLLLYGKTNNVVVAQHHQFLNDINRFNQIDSSLNQDILKAQFDEIEDYDALPERVNQLTQTAARLAANIPSFVPALARRDIRASLADLSRLLQAKETLIERFKSENAVLCNSLRYLPTAGTELAQRFSGDEEDRDAKAALTALIQQVLVYSLHASAEQASAIHQSSRKLDDWRSQHAARPEAEALASLARHADSIVQRKPAVETLTRQILAVPLALRSEELRETYNNQFTQATRTADQFRVILRLLCALLVLAVGYTIYALDAAKRNLEARVEDRTRALKEEAASHLSTAEERDRFFTASRDLLCICNTNGLFIRLNPECQRVLGWVPDEQAGQPFLAVVHEDDRPAVIDRVSRAASGIQVVDFEIRCHCKDGSYRWISWTSSGADKDGRFYSCGRDVTEQRETQRALRLMETSVERSPDGVWWLDCDANFVYVNEAACRSVGLPRERLLAMRLPEIAVDLSIGDWKALWNYKSFAGIMQGHFQSASGRIFPVETTFSRIVFGNRELICAYTRDITERKRAESELDRVHKELVDISRQAGMAEVATSVLHNVGNVLNSVNVSATLVADRVKKSKSGNLGRVVDLLETHSHDLAGFVSSDAKGQQLPNYLRQLHIRLLQEQEDILVEIASLCQNVEHIKEIVSMQQNYAKVSGVSEVLKPTDLVEDALRMNAAALARHDVSVVRDYQDSAPIAIEKQKVLQILINLIRNAKYACDESGRADKQLKMHVSHETGKFQIAVIDNGIGIPPENLTRIFAHGFTTRANGHGFGLHRSALAAREMGGFLRVHSDGVGKGATFTLDLPAHQGPGIL